MPSPRVRDGFYLRVASGLSLGKSFVSNGELSFQDYDVAGAGLEADVLIGGSALPGFASGGAVSFFDVGLGSDDGTATLVLIGAFVDGYLLEGSGFHLGGQLGVASSHARAASGADDFDGGGLAASVWMGHDFEVAPAWSVGGLLRFNAATARDPDHGEFEDPVALRASTFQLALELTAVYY